MSDGGFIATFILGIVAFIAAVVGIVLTAENHSRHVSCLRVYEQSRLETRVVGILSPECYVKVNDNFVPVERWRIIDD